MCSVNLVSMELIYFMYICICSVVHMFINCNVASKVCPIEGSDLDSTICCVSAIVLVCSVCVGKVEMEKPSWWNGETKRLWIAKRCALRAFQRDTTDNRLKENENMHPWHSKGQLRRPRTRSTKMYVPMRMRIALCSISVNSIGI